MSLKDKILKLRNEGKSYRQIQTELGCAKSTISYYCGEGQKEKTTKRRKQYAAENPWVYKSNNFVERYKNKDITYNGKYFDRNKLNEYVKSVDKCYLTGKEIDTSNPDTYQFDHIIPISKGGLSIIENLGICTPAANRAKSDLMLEEFILLCKDVLENFGYSVKKKRY